MPPSQPKTLTEVQSKAPGSKKPSKVFLKPAKNCDLVAAPCLDSSSDDDNNSPSNQTGCSIGRRAKRARNHRCLSPSRDHPDAALVINLADSSTEDGNMLLQKRPTPKRRGPFSKIECAGMSRETAVDLVNSSDGSIDSSNDGVDRKPKSLTRPLASGETAYKKSKHIEIDYDSSDDELAIMFEPPDLKRSSSVKKTRLDRAAVRRARLQQWQLSKGSMNQDIISVWSPARSMGTSLDKSVSPRPALSPVKKYGLPTVPSAGGSQRAMTKVKPPSDQSQSLQNMGPDHVGLSGSSQGMLEANDKISCDFWQTTPTLPTTHPSDSTECTANSATNLLPVPCRGEEDNANSTSVELEDGSFFLGFGSGAVPSIYVDNTELDNCGIESSAEELIVPAKKPLNHAALWDEALETAPTRGWVPFLTYWNISDPMDEDSEESTVEQNDEEYDLPPSMSAVNFMTGKRIDESTGRAVRYFTVFGGVDDIIYELEVDIRPSRIPGAGLGAFMTFLGARKLRPDAYKRGHDLIKKHYYSAPLTMEPLQAISKGRGLSVSLTGHNLHDNNNSPFWLMPKWRSVKTSPSRKESTSHAERIGFLKLHEISDYVQAPLIEFPPWSCIDLGRYGPLRPQDRKTDEVFSIKSFLFSSAPAEWPFSVDEELDNQLQIIDVTDDITGLPHQAAIDDVMIYINEIGHEGRTQNAFPVIKNDRVVHYFFMLDRPMKHMETVELLTNYGRIYEGIRERKGYGLKNLSKRLSADEDDVGSMLARNFVDRDDAVAIVNLATPSNLQKILEFILHSGLHHLLCSFSPGDAASSCSRLSPLQVVAARRISWIKGVCLGKVMESDYGPHSNALYDLIARLRCPASLINVAMTSGHKEHLLTEAREEILYALRQKVLSPMDKAVWCPLAVRLMAALCETVATTSLFRGDGVPNGTENDELKKQLFSLAKTYARKVRSASNDENAYHELAFLSGLPDGSVFSGSLPNWFQIASPAMLFLDNTTISKGVLASYAQKVTYVDALSLIGCEALVNAAEVRIPADGSYVMVAENSSNFGQLTQLSSLPCSLMNIKGLSRTVNVIWYLTWQVAFLIHAFADNYLADYDAEKLCSALDLDPSFFAYASTRGMQACEAAFMRSLSKNTSPKDQLTPRYTMQAEVPVGTLPSEPLASKLCASQATEHIADAATCGQCAEVPPIDVLKEMVPGIESKRPREHSHHAIERGIDLEEDPVAGRTRVLQSANKMKSLQTGTGRKRPAVTKAMDAKEATKRKEEDARGCSVSKSATKSKASQREPKNSSLKRPSGSPPKRSPNSVKRTEPATKSPKPPIKPKKQKLGKSHPETEVAQHPKKSVDRKDPLALAPGRAIKASKPISAVSPKKIFSKSAHEKKPSGPSREPANSSKKPEAVTNGQKAPANAIKKKAAGGDEAPSARLPAKLIYEGKPKIPFPGEGAWPEGWMQRNFERQSGASIGNVDRYWYTPICQYRLRSSLEVQRFMDNLQRHQGNEVEAWKSFKGK